MSTKFRVMVTLLSTVVLLTGLCNGEIQHVVRYDGTIEGPIIKEELKAHSDDSDVKALLSGGEKEQSNENAREKVEAQPLVEELVTKNDELLTMKTTARLITTQPSTSTTEQTTTTTEPTTTTTEPTTTTTEPTTTTTEPTSMSTEPTTTTTDSITTMPPPTTITTQPAPLTTPVLHSTITALPTPSSECRELCSTTLQNSFSMKVSPNTTYYQSGEEVEMWCEVVAPEVLSLLQEGTVTKVSLDWVFEAQDPPVK